MKKIALHNKYSEYLSTCKNVSDIEVFPTGDIKCNLLVKDDIFSILLMNLEDYKMPTVVLCDPNKDKAKKPHHIYIRQYNLMLLCLSVRDDISVKNKDYKEIIDYTLKRVKKLLSLDKAEELKEFRKEFLYFWNKVSTNKKIELYIDSSNKVKKLNVFKNKHASIVFDKDIEVNESFKKELVSENTDSIYIPLINSSKIMPPFEDELWDKEYLEKIFNSCISEENVEKLESINITTKDVLIVLEMNISDTLPATFLLRVSFSNNKAGSLFERIKHVAKLEHLSSQRCDLGYLFNRIGQRGLYKNKNVLVIGAGSLGSYIISELPKIGINRITIYDDDNFSVENTMRHRLGSLSQDCNKALAMKVHLELNHPQLLVDFKTEKFVEKKLYEYSLEEYDLIIVTTGGTDFLLRLNRQLKNLKPNATVIYTWIEPNGVGVHALPIDYKKQGCFECLYTSNEKNKAHYGNHNTDITIIGTGCGGVFNSYGNLTLLKGSAMVTELVQMYFDGKLNGDKNLLYSIRTKSYNKDDNYIVSRRDFETSKDFYIDKGCEACGIYLQNE